METTRTTLDIQGHRGARGLLPENSIPAFRRALELGVTTLEMDVVISRDRKVVVSHDPFFSSAICLQPNGDPIPAENERDFAIFRMDYDQIRSFDCGSTGNSDFPGQVAQAVRKPLLSEVITMAERFAVIHDRAPVRYNIETKCSPEGDGILHPEPVEFVSHVVGVIREQGVAERSMIQSIDPRALAAARHMAPEIKLSILIDTDGARLDEHLGFLEFTPEVVSPDYRLVDATFIREASALGMQIVPWTINEPVAMKRAVELGVDGFITDYPDVALELFR
jgi:glycerophosphoryl diester phosphodiesterase